MVVMVEVVPTTEREQAPLVLNNSSWEQYISLDEFFTGSGVGIRYLNHELEVAAPVSDEHEHKKSNIGRLIEAWCFDREIRFFGRGNMTMTKQGSAGGEPDESYCFNEKKEVSDLVVEIAITSGGLSKRKFYQVFKVPELWFWRNNQLEVYTYDTKTDDYLGCRRK